MSVEGAVPPAAAASLAMIPALRTPRRPLPLIALGGRYAATLIFAAVCGCGSGRSDSYELRTASSPTGRGSAQARAAPCGTNWCETLWLGPAPDDVRQLAMLPKGDHCEEIAWQADGKRVGFLVNGYQLRIYDAQTRAPAGQVNLVDPDGPPTTRIARGITFSTTGSAITFDDCPRDRSGCRPGLIAVR